MAESAFPWVEGGQGFTGTESNPRGLDDQTSSSIILYSSEGLVFSVGRSHGGFRGGIRDTLSHYSPQSSVDLLLLFTSTHTSVVEVPRDMEVEIRGQGGAGGGGGTYRSRALSRPQINDTCGAWTE